MKTKGLKTILSGVKIHSTFSIYRQGARSSGYWVPGDVSEVCTRFSPATIPLSELERFEARASRLYQTDIHTTLAPLLGHERAQYESVDVKLVLRRQSDGSHVRSKETSGTKPRRYAMVAAIL